MNKYTPLGARWNALKINGEALIYEANGEVGSGVRTAMAAQRGKTR